MARSIRHQLYHGVASILCKYLLIFLFLISGVLFAQGRDEYPAPGRPYGLTYDGANFWYSDPISRKVVRVPESGPPQGFYLGNRHIYGIQFNPDDGHVYVGSDRNILKIHPVSGGIAGQIPVRVEQVAGLALGPDLWYLLEKNTGIVYFYDPRLERIISSFETGLKEASDISLNGNAVWITDGAGGSIYRFDLDTKNITGIVPGPVPEMRGLSFNRSQLWIINRKKQVIQRLSFLEADQYIASGDQKYRLLVKIKINLPGGLTGGNLVLLQPPNSEHQSVSSLRFKDREWSDFNFLGSGARVFAKALTANTPRAQAFEYECTVTARNVRYLITSAQKFAREEPGTSPARFFFTGGEGAFNDGDPREKLQAIFSKNIAPGQDQAAGHDRLRAELDGNLPAYWSALYRFEQDKFAGPAFTTSAYLRNFGWVPLSVPADDPNGMRRFSRAMEFVELYRMPDSQARGQSIAYHVDAAAVSGARAMTAIPASVTVELSGL